MQCTRSSALVQRHATSRSSLVPQLEPSCRRRRLPGQRSLLTSSADTATQVSTADAPQPAISLSEKAVAHISKLKQEMGKDNLLLRVGVKQGGCSGMSYVMDFEQEANVKGDDYVIQYEGFKLACDPKSLLYLFGMNLDYSDALIGGGFSFSNPNAASNCGCGKSFSV